MNSIVSVLVVSIGIWIVTYLYTPNEDWVLQKELNLTYDYIIGKYLYNFWFELSFMNEKPNVPTSIF